MPNARESWRCCRACAEIFAGTLERLHIGGFSLFAAAGIVTGMRLARPDDMDLRRVGAVVYRNSKIEETSLAASMPGPPAMAIARLTNTPGSFTRPDRQTRERHPACGFRSSGFRCGAIDMIEVPVNSFKQRLLAGETQWGIWHTLAHAMTAEALSLAGFDWMLFDTEHSPVEIAELQTVLQAAACGTASAVARPAWNDKVLIKKMLDIGVQSLLIPFVETPEEALAAVRATRYPPEGIRGVGGATRASRYGMAEGYLTKANDQICVLVQIESAGALARLEEIAAVEGVDGIFIGPSDLSASMGFLGNSAAEPVQDAIRTAAGRITAAGKVPGILATNPEDARRYRDWGYRFIAGGIDMPMLLSAARALNTALRKPGN